MANEIMGADLALSLGEAMILVIQGMAGKAPRINSTNNHWEVWDNGTQSWVDTGVKATGADGHSPRIDVTETPSGVILTIYNGQSGDEPVEACFIRDGEDGHSPYIGENGHWFVWDENLAVFVDTGVAASGGGGSSVTVDDALSTTSENPVQNKVVTAALNNKGTYSKPSTGIPKTDLASDVQTSLGKADTAVQPSAISNMATETYVQQQIAAIPDELPVVTVSDNGKSLVVDNGAWGKGYQAARTPRVAMTASDTTPTLDPNKLYVFPTMASLTPTLATPTDNTIINEYHFVFDSGSTATVLTLPATILQPDGFTVEANMHYEVSILEGAMTAQGWAVSSS